MGKTKLFCLPYAGGSAMIFHKWKKHLNSEIELRAIELAGRGRRINEPMYSDRAEAVEDVFQLIKTEVCRGPYALLGHSMGSLIAYELAQKIRAAKLPQPLHVFFSGSSAPHLRDENKKYHLMSEHEFKKEVIGLGGTPPEFFEHPELLELFLPLLKNDFKLAEELQINKREVDPLDINITVFLGKEDDLTSNQCEEWKKHTNQHCRLHYFEGGHFFIHEETDKIVKMINDTLIGSLAQTHSASV